MDVHAYVPSAVIILVLSTSKGLPTTDPRAPSVSQIDSGAVGGISISISVIIIVKVVYRIG